jgi:hypothetical protein
MASMRLYEGQYEVENEKRVQILGWDFPTFTRVRTDGFPVIWKPLFITLAIPLGDLIRNAVDSDGPSFLASRGSDSYQSSQQKRLDSVDYPVALNRFLVSPCSKLPDRGPNEYISNSR